MMRLTTIFCALWLAACGSSPSDPGGGVDSATGDGAGASADASPDSRVAVALPTWQLEDVQPLSPRMGQTYGVDAFTGRVIVVSLLEGF